MFDNGIFRIDRSSVDGYMTEMAVGNYGMRKF